MTELTVAGADFVGYRIEEEIGRGGMGVVYRAYDLRLKRLVALKLIAPEFALDQRFHERFARETELAMSLEHPNVVPIYDAGDVDGRLYLAMRLVPGSDLRKLLQTERALEPARALTICRQVASALDAAHAKGLVHRDVKPSNVLLDEDEHVYLADFGLTRRLDEPRALLTDGRSIGTPAYFAPEQIEGTAVDGRADLYALGCMLFECLTGSPPFARGSRLETAWAHLEEEPPRASKRRAGLPQAVDAVVTRALAKEPEERFATCGALVAAAGQALGLGKFGPPRLRRSLILAGALGLAIVIAGVVIATTANRGGKDVASQLYAGPNTLARIDATTNKVSKVIPVGTDPALAVGDSDDTVWVYSRGEGRIWQVNVSPNVYVVEKTQVSLPAECCSLFTGPVLAADPSSGAWFVEGGFGGTKAHLVHLPIGPYGKQTYPLAITPTGVALGGSAVWVVGHDRHGDEVLRIDPGTGHVTRTLRLPGVDSIAFGYGAVWALNSARATLFKIDPLTTRLAGRPLVVAHSRATRPEIMAPRGDDIWVRVTGDGGTTYRIDPSPLYASYTEVDGPPSLGEDQGQLGSLWWYNWPTGKVNRQEKNNGPIVKIPVTRSRPAAGGPCLTSMAVASGSLWVTVAPLPDDHTCSR